MKTATCECCGSVISAPDYGTLLWGLETHVCSAVSPTVGFAERPAVEQALIGWLVGEYRGACWWFARDQVPLVVC